MAKDEKAKVSDTGLRIATGAVEPGYVRVRVLRNHDSPLGLLRKGEVVDVWRQYYESQTEYTDANGNQIKVNPPVFELAK